MTTIDHFTIAAFALDGRIEGKGDQPISQLSGRWLEHCRVFLDHHGSAFDTTWSGPLSHIGTRFTASSGAALVTFRVRDRVACSLALATGASPAAERDVLSLFADSLRRVAIVPAAEVSSPFSELAELTERPLMVVVPWPDENIDDKDHDLVRELAVHLSADWFRRTTARAI